jgi:DNA-binding NarL/FixJ family response regulator
VTHKIIIADTQSVFRAGVATILATEDDCRIVGQCSDSITLMKAVTIFKHAVVVFAASVEPEIGLLMQTARVRGSSVIAILENNQSSQPYLREKVQGVIYRNIHSADLLQCVRGVGRGETYLQHSSADCRNGYETDMVAERVRERLTPKELKIIGLLLRGYKNKDIATELRNSEQVIKNYLRSIFDKTGVSDRLELALFTMHHELLADAAKRVTEDKSEGIYPSVGTNALRGSLRDSE